MKIYPRVSPLLTHFPADYVNNVAGWGCFDRNTIETNTGKLLSLDIDFGNVCTLNCPHCFRRQNKADSYNQHELSYDEICQLILEAKKLGLRSVKFLGAGDPFQSPKIINFLRFLHQNNVTPAIFTKGYVIGKDELVKHYFGVYGITTGEQLCKELAKLQVSILLGFNSFKPTVQNHMVGDIQDYTTTRNRALELLVQAGMNKYYPTHLAIGANPITNENYDEVLEIYKWGRVRNLYVVACPTMVSGRCSDNSWRTITPSEDKLVDLYIKIYKFNLESGLQTIRQIKSEEIAAYAGAHPCNQVACGMYITLNGTVLRCPGDDTTIFGNVREKSLTEIWHSSENYRRSGTFNCGCPPKVGKSIPSKLFERVMNNLL